VSFVVIAFSCGHIQKLKSDKAMDESHKPERIEAIADDLSRRQWLLRLGELVALAGVSGALPEFAIALARGQGSDLTQLPPGLYEASQDHLVHALSSAGKSWSAPAGSETEYAMPASIPYAPQFFPPEDFKVVTRMIEIFLGKVDPTAIAESAQWLERWLQSAPAVRTAARQLDPIPRALAVAYYGEESVRALEDFHPDATARVGLHALQDLCVRLYSRDFLQLTESEQRDLLRTTSTAAPKTEVHKFFELVRTEAIRGYYTSAKGLEELDYKGNAYYTECPGCEKPTLTKPTLAKPT